MRNLYKNIFAWGSVFILIACTGDALLAQEPIDSLINFDEVTAGEILQVAEDLYDLGRIQEIDSLLLIALDMKGKDGFDEIQKQRAYALLVNTQLYENEEEKAQSYLIEILKINPEYRYRNTDIQEVEELFKTVRLNPIFYIGGHIGANMSLANNTTSYTLDTNPDNTGIYQSEIGAQLGAKVGYAINSRISVFLELGVDLRSFSFQKQLFDYASLNYKENMIAANAPIFVQFFLKNQFNIETKWRPYVYAGVSPILLLSSNATVTRSDVVSEDEQRQVQGPNVQVTEQRNNLNFALLGGIGMQRKIGLGFAYMDVRYMQGINNVVNTSKRFDNNELIFRYGYIDNDFLLSSYYLSVGYIYPIYKPKPLKKKKKKLNSK